MKRLLNIVLLSSLGLCLLVAAYVPYAILIQNPEVIAELIESPGGDRAKRVMLITLPSGRRLPVNYLFEAPFVYAGADGSWWRELEAEADEGFPVSLLIQGKTYRGSARAVRDDPHYTQEIFTRLRPNAIPGFGTLVEVRLESAAKIEAGMEQ
ncbi:MAG: hypothetical protein CBC48_11160 [bacterium TMED88]|nr:hypothetical protein [Deltaproteobacteria bacterium]OUV29995.1 MAG: hypothetical protein CBC48_11160 [bacterium TMED88]